MGTPVFVSFEAINGEARMLEHDALRHTDAEIAAEVTPANFAFSPGPLVDVHRYGAVGDGVANEWTAIQNAVAVINAAGGGTLIFHPGHTYRIYVGTQTGNLCNFEDLTGITILGNGCTLVVDLDRTITASLGVCFAFDNCKNIFVDGFTTDGPTLDVSSTTVKSVEFVRCTNGCRAVHLGTNYIKNWLSGFIASKAEGDADSMRTQHIVIDVLDVQNCWYGINCQYSGDAMTVHRLRCDTIHRSFFVYGASHIKASIWSKDHKGTDVPIGSSQSVGMENVEIHYHSDTDSTSCGNAAKVYLAFSGQTAQIIRDIRIHLHVRYLGSGNTGGAALVIAKLDNSAAADTTDRGHILQGLTVSGLIEGQGSYTGYGSATLVMDVNATWGTGDFFRQIALSHLRILPTSSAGNPILTLGNCTDQITLHDVYCSRSIILRNDGTDQRIPYVARVVLEGVSCTNRWALDADSNTPLDNLRAVSTTDTVRAGWSGKAITNTGTGGDMVWSLPAAVVGLEYTFARQAANVLDIDPNGSEVIRGGSAGQILRMNAAGNLVKLVCYIAGMWEIAYVQGSTSFV